MEVQDSQDMEKKKILGFLAKLHNAPMINLTFYNNLLLFLLFYFVLCLHIFFRLHLVSDVDIVSPPPPGWRLALVYLLCLLNTPLLFMGSCTSSYLNHSANEYIGLTLI